MQKVVIEPFIETINELLQTNGFIAANAKNYVNPVNILKFTGGYKRQLELINNTKLQVCRRNVYIVKSLTNI